LPVAAVLENNFFETGRDEYSPAEKVMMIFVPNQDWKGKEKNHLQLFSI